MCPSLPLPFKTKEEEKAHSFCSLPFNANKMGGGEEERAYAALRIISSPHRRRRHHHCILSTRVWKRRVGIEPTPPPIPPAIIIPPQQKFLLFGSSKGTRNACGCVDFFPALSQASLSFSLTPSSIHTHTYTLNILAASVVVMRGVNKV